MSGFKMDDYVDVAERIREFSAKYPDGSLQSEIQMVVEPQSGWLCTAYAYRTPDDPKPGVGHAFEIVPGKTPYTKDSEAMNAETSAWGRAIVALGFETKKIASAQEVKARQDNGEQRDVDPHGLKDSRADAMTQTSGAPGDATDKQKAMVTRLAKKLSLDPGDVTRLSKRDASGKIEELLALEKAGVEVAAGGGGEVDPDIPFARTFA